jgi:cytochrome c-type biogenesis protein CcmE
MRRKTKVAAGLGVIVASLVYLVVTGFQNTSVYYLTVSELYAREMGVAGKRVKVAGKVAAGSISQDRGTMQVSFRAEEGGKTLPVVYRGIVPDTFKDGAEVVVEGKREADGTFRAETLLAKCPSKYEGMDLEQIKKQRRS